MYNLPPDYVARFEPDYFNDTLDDSHLWQADVYRLAVDLARETGVKRIIDLGCGNGQKLKPYRVEFDVVGVDYGANIELFSQTFGQGKFITCDLNSTVIPPETFQNAVAICADVIEHLPTPEHLVESLRNAVQTAAYVLVSTPDRERVSAAFHAALSGPPINPAHVREWTNDELQGYFESEHLPIRWAGWTISNEIRPDQMWTSLLVLSNKHPVDRLPIRYQPHPRYKPAARQGASDTIKVWMTPTPSEAGRDITNAIHQCVLRLDQHLPDYGVELVENPDNADLFAAHAGQGTPSPVDVAHYHGLYNTAAGHSDRSFFAINQQVIRNLRYAKVITAPSEWIADVIRRDMHINPTVIGWGVDANEWQPVTDPGLYVLWNKARVDAISDPSPMLELAARVPNMPFLTTFGEGGANVKTIGRQPYEAMKNYVCHASVYLATVTETFGIATLEAMAAGVPVLGFRHGNTAELVEHGVTGFLAEPGDMDGLVEGLIYCMKYRDRLGANAREAAKAHTWERVAQQFADVYRRALEPSVSAVKVSVVIPCHNYEQYVGEAIESALAQEASFGYEIIVVLDRCTDTSAKIIGQYAERGVKSITVDNGSLSATRNDGISIAQGQYIVCLDADDRLGHSHFLQALSEALDTDRTLGIAFTGITVMDADGNLGHKNNWPNGFSFEAQMQRRNQIPSCCMFRKQAWERAGGFRPWFKYAEDAEFWSTVLNIGYGAKHVVDDGWFHYRLHNKSASQVHRTGEIREPDWLEFHPGSKDGQFPFAAPGQPRYGSWPVRFYLKPDVSIIIPVGSGHEETLKDALHSVEGQTHRYWECIVVNDTNKPLDLIGFPWVKVIDTPLAGRQGAGAARNLGVKNSHANFVIFLDADDILKPTFVEKALKAFKDKGRYAYCDWMTDDGRGKVEIHPTPDYSFEALWEKPSLHPVTALIPRVWFNQVGGFDESLAAYEDVDLFMKLRTHGFCGVRIPEPLLVYNLETGKRRKLVEKEQGKYRQLLIDRYREFMEGKMCDCVEPPKGKLPAPPNESNVADYRDAYGDMVLVQYTYQYAGVSPTTLVSPATRVNYGQRAKDDIFYIWQADLDANPEMFTKVEDYVADAPKTVVPPPPKGSEPVEKTLADMTGKELRAWAERQNIEIPKTVKNVGDTREYLMGLQKP